jgi:hypothetical protein
MKVRFLSILTVGAVLLGGAALMAPAASASRSPQAAVHAAKPFHVAVPGSITKGYCNYTADAVNDSLSSQNFEASFDAYDDMGAADCKIGRHAKLVHQIVAPGVYYNGYGPAVSENVITWANAAGLPGAVKNSQTVAGADNAGSFTIALTPFKVKGTVWFTVQANMDFSAGGQWGWDASTVAHVNADQWENPGGGFGLGSGWNPLSVLDGTSVSFLYAIS